MSALTHDYGGSGLGHRPDGRWWGLACGALVLLAGLLTLPVALTEGDTAEWLIIARFGGVPHPSGYPLYAIVCRLFGLFAPALPWVSAVALASVLAAALAAVLVYGALWRWSFGPHSAALATLGVFLSSSVWRIANMPEPFAANLLLAACVLWLAVALDTRRNEAPSSHNGTRVFLLGVCYGLGFCNHHSLVLTVPLGLWGLWRAGGAWSGRFLRFGGGFVLGLLPLFYLVSAKDDASPYNYYALETWKDLGQLLFRVHYGTFQLAQSREPANWGSVWHYLSNLPGWLSFVLFAILLLGLYGLFVDLLKRPARAGLSLAWAAAFLCTTVLFLRLFNVQVEGWIGSIVERFMALPTMLLAVPLGRGFESLFEARSRLPKPIWVGLSAVVVVAHAGMQSLQANRMGDFFYEDHARTVMQIAEANGGVLVTASDAETLGAMHTRYIQGEGGKDLWWLNAPHWHSRRFRTLTVSGFGLDPSYIEKNLTDFVAGLVELRGRVVVSDLPLPPLPPLFGHSFVVGPATVLLRSDLALPSADELLAMNQAVYAQSFWNDVVPMQQSAWDRALLDKYLKNLTLLAELGRAQAAPKLTTWAEDTRRRLEGR